MAIDIFQQQANEKLANIDRLATERQKQIDLSKNLLMQGADISKNRIKSNALTSVGDIGYSGAKAGEIAKSNAIYGGLGGSGAMVQQQNDINNKIQTGILGAKADEQTKLEDLNLDVQKMEAQNAETQFNFDEGLKDDRQKIIDFYNNARMDYQEKAAAKALAEQERSDTQLAQSILNQFKMDSEDADGKFKNSDYQQKIYDYINNPNVSANLKQKILNTANFTQDYISDKKKQSDVEYNQKVVFPEIDKEIMNLNTLWNKQAHHFWGGVDKNIWEKGKTEMRDRIYNYATQGLIDEKQGQILFDKYGL